MKDDPRERISLGHWVEMDGSVAFFFFFSIFMVAQYPESVGMSELE